MKKKTKFMKLVFIDDFIFDANRHTEAEINGVVQKKFDAKTKPGSLVFNYKRTSNGYSYTIDRNIPYAYNGFIFDLDCSFLTGEPIELFQVNLANPSQKPYVYVIPGSNSNGYYAPIRIFEDFYKLFLGQGSGTEKPQKVQVWAGSTQVGVDVVY